MSISELDHRVKPTPLSFEKELASLADGRQLEVALKRMTSRFRRIEGHLRRSLLHVSADPTSFVATYGVTRARFHTNVLSTYRRLATCEQSFDDKDLLQGYLGLLYVTVSVLEAVDRRIAREAEDLLEESCLGVQSDDITTILEDPSVQAVFERLYKPRKPRRSDASSPSFMWEQAAWDHWHDLDLSSLQFHRAGTTSFILRCKMVPQGGEAAQVALKCVLYPYTNVAPIAEATRTYAERYREPQAKYIPHVRSSCDKWILMDFVAGPTLREFLEEQAPPHARRYDTSSDEKPLSEQVQFRPLRRAGLPLFDALDELANLRSGMVHLDLSPSNVILVEEGDRIKPVLVDLGRNYLYSRALGSLETQESAFVAPEVKNEDGDWSKADLFSLGLILIELMGVSRGGSRVPDVLFQESPFLARFIEDLLDREPEKRLLLAPTRNGTDRFKHLKGLFEEVLQASEASQDVAPSDENWFHAAVTMCLPSQRRPRTHWKIWRQIQQQQPVWSAFWSKRKQRNGTFLNRYAGWLLGWSLVCATSWFVVISAVILWGLRDFQFGPFQDVVEILQRFSKSQDTIPVLDDLRAADYEFGDLDNNLPPRIIGLTTGLAATKYYQNIFAGLTTRPIRGALSWLSEASMRFGSLWFVPLIVITNVVQPGLWTWFSGLGLLYVAVNNYVSWRLAKNMTSSGRAQFSTVPTQTDRALEAFGEWWWTMLMYVSSVLMIAWGLETGRLQDKWVYVGVLVVVNIWIFYISKCSRLAPSVRGSLTRAFVVGERLAALDQQAKVEHADKEQHTGSQ